MYLLTRYLEGRPHPQGRRLAGVQRCLRTTDLDEVGDDRHLTVFQMLGSWSLGDYDGPQSLRWAGSCSPTDWASAGTGCTPRCSVVMSRWPRISCRGRPGPSSASPVERLGTVRVDRNGPPRGTPGTDGRWMEL